MTKRSILIAAAGLLLMCGLAMGQGRGGTTQPVARQPGQQPQANAIQEKLMPLDEIGPMLLDDALEAVRVKMPEFNFVVVRDPNVRPDYPILPKMNLKNVKLGQFIDFIRTSLQNVSIREIGEGGTPLYSVQIIGGPGLGGGGGRGGGGGGAIFQGGGFTGGRGGGGRGGFAQQQQPVVSVYRVTPIINGMMKNGLAKEPAQAMKDVLSVVQSALEELGDDGIPVSLKVHEPTQTLMFKGSPQKGVLLESVLRALEPSKDEMDSARNNEQAAKEAAIRRDADEMKIQIKKLEMVIEQRDAVNSRLEAELTRARAGQR